MATVKRLNNDYNIYAPNVTINGNLVVVGTTSQITTVDTLVYDNIITLAAGQNGGPTLNAGIEVDRGINPKVGLRWHEESLNWQYTNNGYVWKSFSMTKVQEDVDPHLGGNLFVDGFTITANVGHTVNIGPIISIPHITSDPDPINGYSTIYAKTTGPGETGIFMSNDKTVGQELITKRKAFIYSIIF